MNSSEKPGLPRASRFEDLVCWQKARLLTREVYRMSRRDSFGRDWDLARQVRSASVSVMANIAEGYDRHGTGELRHHLSIAAGSCSEVRSHLYVIEDEGYASPSQTEAVRELAEEVLRLTIAFQNSIRKG